MLTRNKELPALPLESDEQGPAYQLVTTTTGYPAESSSQAQSRQQHRQHQQEEAANGRHEPKHLNAQPAPPGYGVIQATGEVASDGRIQVDLEGIRDDAKLAAQLSRLREIRDDECDSEEANGDGHVDVEQYQVMSVKKMKKLNKAKARIEKRGVPVMNIVIMIVGSRGDVQPYVALALELIKCGGHRVRIATHGNFRKFVLDANKHLKGLTRGGIMLEGRLEFFDAGGDPEELMAYMVKNPGLLPGLDSLTNGDVQRKKEMTSEYLRGFFLSTFCDDVVSGKPFAADAILANPPSFAHIHVAEALGIPLVMTFTMPWSPTGAFSHPLVQLRKSNVTRVVANYFGYSVADNLMWHGLADEINRFRTEILSIPPLEHRFAVDVIENLRIPHTYCWSPALLPKPNDWRSNLDISGFYFLENDTEYKPPPTVLSFLSAGEPPVYIGFGSVVVPDSKQTTDVIVQAVKLAGVRAIISSGWAKLGEGLDDDDQIMSLRGMFLAPIPLIKDNIPHDWLFADSRVSAVCHHGGAGTTAIGLRNGRPTIIVPFFGDQMFWGEVVAAAGAGPNPIPFKKLDVENLSAALTFCQAFESLTAAEAIGERIRRDKGEERGVTSFHRNVPLSRMRCDILSQHVAVWYDSKYNIRLSAIAAGVLVEQNKLDFKDLKPHRSIEYDTNKHYHDPVVGTSRAINGVLTTSVRGVAELFTKPVQGAVNIVYGVPKGDFYEGVYNLPHLMGSSSRTRDRVTTFGKGLGQGLGGLGLGIWDGVTGLFVEPIDGAIRQGPWGVMKGFGRGCANLIIRPVAGSLGFFVLPVQGTNRELTSLVTQRKPKLDILRAARQTLSVQAAESASENERREIIAEYEKLTQRGGIRRKWRRQGKKVVLLPNKEERCMLKEKKDMGRVWNAGMLKEELKGKEKGTDSNDIDKAVETMENGHS